MSERKKRVLSPARPSSLRLALICFAAMAAGRAHADGHHSPANGDPLTGPIHEAGLCLSPFRTLGAGTVGSGGLMTVSPQQQPFGEVQVRLRRDDPDYTRRSSPWTVALKVVATDAFVWAAHRFIFNYPWSHVGPNSWKNNLASGWEWDTDRLGMNFFFHPYSGSAFYSSARANGYGYFAAVPFVFLGSLLWEYFGETSPPAYNDIINTTASGALFGEILYRLSSNILDDRTTGVERFLRELTAAILSPGRAFSRLLQGKLAREAPKEIYQKEPLNVSLTLGSHWFNHGATFGTGSASAIFGVHLDYGDPFEIRPRRPFDFFKLRIDLSYGKNVAEKYLDNVIAYGLWFGKTFRAGRMTILAGAFQHYDYWDSRFFEVSALGFGPGLIARWPLAAGSDLQAALHLKLIPLGASDSPYVDIVESGIPARNYDYSGGGGAKFEGTLNLARLGQVTAIYYLYRLHTYIGPAADKTISIFKPRIAVRLSRNLSVGFEYTRYRKHSNLRDHPDVLRNESEQKLYLLLYF